MELALEVVTVPVSDIDRATAFSEQQLGFHVDMDVAPAPGIRFVQLTPPGSACSIHLAAGTTRMSPGSLDGPILVVDSAADARDRLAANGVVTGEIHEMGWDEHVAVDDPDGNTWTIQESFARNARSGVGTDGGR